MTKFGFFKKISIIKARTLYPNPLHMGKKNTLAAAAFTALAASATPVNSNEEQKQTPDQTQIICETREACQKLTDSIQAQIDELEAKGIKNLTDDEFGKYIKLSDSLIAAEKSETKQNDDLITAENQKQQIENGKQEQQNKLLNAIDTTDENLSALKGALL